MNDPVSGRKSGIVPENKTGFTVAASPFNPVKLELGVILIIGFFLLFIVPAVVNSKAAQFSFLSAYGLVSMLWLIYRVHRIRKIVVDFNG